MVMMDDRPAATGRAQLIEALRTINLLQEQLVAERKVKPVRTAEPIAIVGRALRMPGGATSPESWWPLLHDGIDATTEFPAQRADAAGYLHPDPDHPGTAYVMRGGFLDQIDQLLEFAQVHGFRSAFERVSQRRVITAAAEAADRADRNIGEVRGPAERLTRVDVRQVHFDKRHGHGRKGVPQGHAGVGEAARVDDDRVHPFALGRLDTFDQLTLVIALEALNHGARRMRRVDQPAVDLG